MSKSGKEPTVGSWGEKKLTALEDYLSFYTGVLKNEPFELVYIDAFAGAPDAKFRDADNSVEELPLEVDEVIVAHRKNYIASSPLRALKFKKFFKRFYFFDKDEIRVKTLNDVCDAHKNVTVARGDCNDLIRDLAPKIERHNVKGVTFLDPYGLQVKWKTLQALASTGKMEVIVNLPIGMAINRLTPVCWNDFVDSHHKPLNEVFGTNGWFKQIYSQGGEDFDGRTTFEKKPNSPDLLLKFYLDRLEKLFGYVADPLLIKGDTGIHLYYLIWAGPKKKGKDGADYIFGRKGGDARYKKVVKGATKPNNQLSLDL